MPPKIKRPKWKTADVIRVGRGALELATKRRSELEPRLSAGLLEGLAADLTVLEDKGAEVAGAPEALRAATRTQDAALAEGKSFVITAREAIDRSDATDAQRAEFGLKLRVRDGVGSVITAIDKFLEGAKKHPDVALEATVLPADLETMRALRAEIVGADAAQEAKKTARKEPLLDRNAAHLRIERAVGKIVSAGLLAYAKDPEVAALFRALLPASRSSARTRAAKAARKPEPAA